MNCIDFVKGVTGSRKMYLGINIFTLLKALQVIIKFLAMGLHIHGAHQFLFLIWTEDQ